MKALLDHRFAPVTFKWGFVECAFIDFSRAYVDWTEGLGSKSGPQTEYRSFQAPLNESLLALDPLVSPQDRYLLTATRSNWSAIFSNGLNTNDVHSPVSYLPTVLGCRGIEIACTPDRSKNADKDGLQIYGAVTFALYGPHEADWLNRIRRISVTNDVSGWEFSAAGEVQAYEQIANYQKRKIVDRFTPEMLEAYCAALGIRLFDADFYGVECLAVHEKLKTRRGLSMPIAEARLHVYL